MFPRLSSFAVAALTCAMLFGGTVDTAAQVTLPHDTSLTGILSAEDRTLPDSNRFDEFVVHGKVGERVHVGMRSSDLDSFLLWGTGVGDAFSPVDGNDDGGGGRDAELNVTILRDGQYVVRATSFVPDGRGLYQLEVHTTSSSGEALPSPIRAGERVEGSVDAVGADAYVYHATAGEALNLQFFSAGNALLRVSTVEHGLASLVSEQSATGGSVATRLVLDSATTLLFETIADGAIAGDQSYQLKLNTRRATAMEAPPSPIFVQLGDHYILQTPLPYRIGSTSDRIIVPAGFVTDQASIPYLVQWLIHKNGLHSVPAIIHDYLYWTHACSRDQADRLFLHAMADTRTPLWQRELIFKAVHLFGESAYAENARSREQGDLRILPQAWRTPSAATVWQLYHAQLRRLGVTPDPDLPVTAGFCNRGSQLRPPGVPY